MSSHGTQYATGYICSGHKNEFIIGKFPEVKAYVDRYKEGYRTVYVHHSKLEMKNFIRLRMQMEGYRTSLVEL